MDPEVKLRRIQTDCFVLIARVLRRLDDHLAGLLAREGIEGITPRQSHVLLVLYHAATPLPARRIAEALAISEVTCGRFIHALAGSGWVARRRDPEDGRNVLVSLTDKTLDAVPAFLRVSNAVMDAAFTGLSAADVEHLARTIEHLADNLGIAPNDPADGP